MVVWIDSHTEEYFGGGERGQRLACNLLQGIDLESGLEVNRDEAFPGYNIEPAIQCSVLNICEEDHWVRVAVSEEEGRIAVGRNDGIISIFEYV